MLSIEPKKRYKRVYQFQKRIPITNNLHQRNKSKSYDKVLNYLRQESIYAFPTAQAFVAIGYF